MTPDQARATLESVLTAALTNTGLPLSFTNDLSTTPNTTFGRIIMLHTDARQRSWTGAECHWENIGRVIVEVSVPPGEGVRPAYQRLATIKASLGGKKFSMDRLRIGAPTVRDIGTNEKTGWWAVQVSFPFVYDDDSIP